MNNPKTEYKIQLTKEDLINLARILEGATFNFEAGSHELLRQLVASYPKELKSFEGVV
jgi:hypothetical protein